MSNGIERGARLVPSRQSTLGYLFWLSRPRFWFYLAGPVLVGLVYAAPSPGALIDPVAAVLFVYFLLPANVFLYGINDVFDAPIDQENPKKAADGKEVRFTGELLVPAVVVICAVLGSLLVPFVPPEGGIALLGFLVLGAAYSAPPLRFKTTPFLDSVSNGLYVLPAVVAYTAIAGTMPPALALAAGWVWAMGMHTFSAIPDIEPDRQAGIQTTATVLGHSRTLGYCFGCWTAAAALIGLHHPGLAAIFVVYPLFVAAIVAFGVDIRRAYWWFPVINTVAGAMLTMGGIWVMIDG